MSYRISERIIYAVTDTGDSHSIAFNYSRSDLCYTCENYIGHKKYAILSDGVNVIKNGDYVPEVKESDLQSFFTENKTDTMDEVIINADFPLGSTVAFEVVTLDYISGNAYNGSYTLVTENEITSYEYNLKGADQNIWEDNIATFTKLVADIGPEYFEDFLSKVTVVPMQDAPTDHVSEQYAVNFVEEEL